MCTRMRHLVESKVDLKLRLALHPEDHRPDNEMRVGPHVVLPGSPIKSPAHAEVNDHLQVILQVISFQST